MHPDAELVEGDLRDEQAVERAFQMHPGIEAVMHFASYTLVGESMQRPELYLRDNVNAGVTLMAEAVRHGVGRFILSSTANLFDAPERMPIDETESIIPGSPYGESKHILERSLYWYDRVHQLRYAALRYFNAAGATERVGEAHDPRLTSFPWSYAWPKGRLRGSRFSAGTIQRRTGTCVRDYIHVVDLARAHILALEALSGGSRVYNLGNGAGFSNKQVIDTAEKITGRSIPYTIGPRRPGDPATLIASSERIRKELGWQPRYPDLESIIGSAWAWRSKHPNGYA